MLVAIILVVYYPAFLSGIHPIDDPGIVGFYSASPSLSSILFSGNGYYFRPIVGLTFFLDNFLWGMEPGIMHLENILLHCANTLLVYRLARMISNDDEPALIPLLAALLFALHPINVESVAWIAGRTDPLLALFLLSAMYFLLRWLDSLRWQYIATAMLMFAAALMTKETAVAFVAVALLFALAWPGSITRQQRFKIINIILVPTVLLVMLVMFFLNGTNGLSRFMNVKELQVAHSLWEALIALGFYARKLIIPFPLNFAITDVHPMHGLLGVAFIPFLVFVFRRYRFFGVLFISGVLFIFPAILIAVKQIAWTPFAERYLYLPTAFFALGVVGIYEQWQQKYSVLLNSFFVLLFCGYALVDYQRNQLWNDSLAFFQDAVAKSPEFGSVYYSLGGEFLRKGEIDLASAAFATADRLNKRDSMRFQIKQSIMGVKLAKGEYLESRTYFFQTFNKKQEAPVVFLELLYKADGKRLETLDRKSKTHLAHDMLETLGILYLKNADPFWLYRSGQIALITGKAAEAADFFLRAYNTAPPDAHYKESARINYLRLVAE